MSETTDEHGGLSRSLSHEQMTMIALGSALGTGLFLGSGAAIAIAGPAVIISYAIGSLLAAVIASAAGEMAVEYPVRGGFGALAGRFLGSFGGYTARWVYWATTVCVSGAELVAVATYLNFWWPDFPLWAGILIFGAVVMALNASSVKSFGSVEFFLSGIKVLAVVAFIVIGLLLIFVGLPQHPAHGTGNLVANGFFPHGFSSVWMALAVVMFSFGGIELVSISAAEAKDPVRSVRSAGKATVWRLASFYVLAMFVVMSLMPLSDAMNSGELASSPFVRVFSEVGIPAAASIINFIVLIAALSAANANVYAATRLLHSLSYEGMAPKALRKTTRTGIPLGALGASSIGILLVIVLAVVTKNVFLIMMAVATTFVLVVWMLILMSYIAYRRKVGPSPNFRLLGGPVMAGIALAALVSVFVAVFLSPDMQVAGLFGLAYFVLIAVLYLVVVRKHVRPDERAFHEAAVATSTSSMPAVKRKKR